MIYLGRRYAGEGSERAARMWCPGCERVHQVLLDGPVTWEWNGSTDRATFTPSILVRWGADRVCHSFLTDGTWNYLADSTHQFAGQAVLVPPIPAERLAHMWWHEPSTESAERD